MSHNQEVGSKGEEAAAQFYIDKGYKLLARNWRPGPGSITHRGELDLVLCKGRRLVFCEVKTRTSDRYGSGASAVGHTKQQALRRLATEWLRASTVHWNRMRFDVAVVDGHGSVRFMRVASSPPMSHDTASIGT